MTTTLLTTDIIGEAINTARAMHALATDAGELAAADLIKVVAFEHLDETGEWDHSTYQVIGTDTTPDNGIVIFAHGELTPEA